MGYLVEVPKGNNNRCLGAWQFVSEHFFGPQTRQIFFSFYFTGFQRNKRKEGRFSEEQKERGLRHFDQFL